MKKLFAILLVLMLAVSGLAMAEEDTSVENILEKGTFILGLDDSFPPMGFRDENNDIVGEAASVDVTSTEDIILWYGTRYQVNLGDTSRLDYKVDCMNDAILQMSDYQSGVLDISFTIWPNQVGYTPFA